VTINFGDRRYRVRGWQKNLAFDQLRVNVMASNDRGMFVDTFDIYAAKYRKTFIAQTGGGFGGRGNTIKKDLGRLLLKLEELQDNHIENQTTTKTLAPTMNGRREASRFGALARSTAARSHRDGFSGGRREHQQAGRLSRGGCRASWISRWRSSPVEQRRRQDSPHGRCALLRAAGGSGQVFRDDRANRFLHGGNEPQAQNPRHRRGRRGAEKRHTP